jgi:uncharacterized protein (TIGR03435 family)
MNAEFRIRRLLRRHLRWYGQPPRERAAAALDRVWETLEPHVAHAQTAPRFRLESLETESRRGAAGPWRVRIAAAVVLVAAAVTVAVVWRPADEALFRVAEGNVQPGDPPSLLRSFGGTGTVRSNGAAGAVLELSDGSRVEMRTNSELSLERADDGLRVRLNAGGIIVNAAKQRTGHLYVQTKDMTVSVVGTVFVVSADSEGSRVVVIEGEVHVRQGVTETKLLPGERVTTTPLMPSRPVIEELAWSRNAEEHVLLLQQSVVLERSPAPTVATAPQNRADMPQAFELASVRPSDAAAPGGRGRPVGSHNTGPCTNGASQIDPRRFVAPNNTLYTLITLAYGMGSCLSTVDRVSGGPGWIRSDRFDVEALIPEGSPSYTAQQFHRGEAPLLQGMLRMLLEDRFKLAVHREMKEGSVYLLELEKDVQKLTPWKDGAPGPAPGAAGRRSIMAAPGYVEGQKASMADLASQLTMVTGRPVLDRTGVAGEFNYSFQFAPLDTTFFAAVPNPEAALRPSLFTVLGERLGLKLQGARAPVEVLVIDGAERPTEN